MLVRARFDAAERIHAKRHDAAQRIELGVTVETKSMHNSSRTSYQNGVTLALWKA